MCQGVVFPNDVTYQLSVSASPEACTELAGRLPLTAQLQFIGFGSVEVNISLLCDCNCDAPVSTHTYMYLACDICMWYACGVHVVHMYEVGLIIQVENSDTCSGVGRLECSICICNDERV